MPDRDLISRRVLGVDASGIRKVFDLAAKLKDPINFSIGLPDFDVPEPAKEAAIAAIRAGSNRYTQTQGIATLRQRLRADLTAEMGRDVGEVLITSGVAGGLLLALMAVLDPGDEAIFCDPYFVMYKHMTTMCSGKSLIIDSYPDFKFPAEKMAAAITPRTKVMILSSPANPTGVVMTEAEVRQAVEIARQHQLLIISDEIYASFLYGKPGKPQEKAKLSSAGQHYENTLILRGFSKSHAMTGWRLGYAVGPEAVIGQMTKLQQYSYICAPSPLQFGALAALDLSMQSFVDSYEKKRDLVVKGLQDKFELVVPQGAFYVFPKAPGAAKASAFVTRAIENNVLIIPGNVFSEKDTHFRISYATTDEKLEQGCEILRGLA